MLSTFLADSSPNLTSSWAGNLEYSKTELVEILNTLMWIPWVIKSGSGVQNISLHFYETERLCGITKADHFLYNSSLFFSCCSENNMVQYFLCHFLWYMNQYKGMKGDMIPYRCNNIKPEPIYNLTPVGALQFTSTYLLCALRLLEPFVWPYLLRDKGQLESWESD